MQTLLPLRPCTVGHHPKSSPGSWGTWLWWQQPRGRCRDSRAVPYAGTKLESSRGPVAGGITVPPWQEPGQGSGWAPERCLRARTAGHGDSETRREIQTHSRPPQPSDQFPGSFRFGVTARLPPGAPPQALGAPQPGQDPAVSPSSRSCSCKRPQQQLPAGGGSPEPCPQPQGTP